MTYIKPILPAVLVALLLLQLAAGRGWRRRIGVALVLILLGASWRPVSYVCLLTLEAWYPVQATPAGDAQAIVLLSAGALELFPPTPQWVSGDDAYLRSLHAAWLYKNWKPLPIYISGGRDRPGAPPVASVMKATVEAYGVPPDAVRMEMDSTSTAENAVFTARQLQASGIHKVALVTHATHMARSVRVFRKAGLEVVPAPCAFRTARFVRSWLSLIPSYQDYRDTEDVLHEWVGMAFYLSSGRM